MPITTSTLGSLKQLAKYFNDNNFTLKLFTNDFTPTKATVVGDFTEVSGGGYAAIPLTAGNWTVELVGGIPTARYATRLFEFTGASTPIFGAYVIDSDGTYIFSERGDTEFTPTTAGEVYAVIPQYQASEGTPT